MVRLLLEKGENLVISSHAQFCESDSPTKPRTGDAFLTDRRFVFVGRMQIRTLGQLIRTAKGKGETTLEIPACAIIEVEKEEAEDSIRMVYQEDSKEKDALITPERVRYVGTLLSMGVNMVSKEVGKIVTDSISEKIGEEMGEKVGGYLSGEIEEFTQDSMEEFIKGLIEAWMEAFQKLLEQAPAGGEAEREQIEETTSGVEDLPILKKSYPREDFSDTGALLGPEDLPILRKTHEVNVVLLEQIFEEELGRTFSDVEIPAGQTDYFEILADKVGDAENDVEREKWSRELRKYLRYLKRRQYS